MPGEVLLAPYAPEGVKDDDDDDDDECLVCNVLSCQLSTSLWSICPPRVAQTQWSSLWSAYCLYIIKLILILSS